MIDYSNIVSAKLNIEYDRDLFISEYDQYILPASKTILNNVFLIDQTAKFNDWWGMVDANVYQQADVRNNDGVMIKQGFPSWLGTSLVYLNVKDDELRENSKNGSVSVRNLVLDSMGDFTFFPQYENLAITKFIKQLPLTSIIGVRCVSLNNSFALIHRDNSNYMTASQKRLNFQPMTDNHLWKSGFVQITINLTDANAPLYYCVTPTLSEQYRTINDPIYLFNDFFYHGVSMTSGDLRRQIRVTGRPTPELQQYIDSLTIETIKELHE